MGLLVEAKEIGDVRCLGHCRHSVYSSSYQKFHENTGLSEHWPLIGKASCQLALDN